MGVCLLVVFFLQTFNVDALLANHGNIDVLSLLHYISEKQDTAVRDLLVGMLYDLTPTDIDSILPQLVHLYGHMNRTHTMRNRSSHTLTYLPSLSCFCVWSAGCTGRISRALAWASSSCTSALVLSTSL